jgi:hypothetical protein
MQLANDVKYANYAEAINSQKIRSGLSESLKKARIIHFPEINHDIIALLSKECVVRLPFRECLLSFEKNVCVLAEEIVRAEEGHVMIEFSMFFRTKVGFYMPPYRVLVFATRDGEIIRHKDGNLIIKSTTSENVSKKDTEEAIAVSRVVLTHLTFINCKNVSLEQVKQASEKVNQRRISHGKKPLYSYYITSIKGKRERASDSEKQGKHYRFHFCRGHFKQRKTGRFWWSQQVRGNKNLGLIIKDYKVV